MSETSVMDLEDFVKAGNCAERISARVMAVWDRGYGKRVVTSADRAFLASEVQKLVLLLGQASDHDVHPPQG